MLISLTIFTDTLCVQIVKDHKMWSNRLMWLKTDKNLTLALNKNKPTG